MDDYISRQQAIDALKKDMASLDHIIKGMSANDVRLDAYVSQRNQVNYDIYTINNLPTAQPEQLSTNLAEAGTDCISRQAAVDVINEYMVGKRCDTDGTMMASLINELVINKLPSAQPEIIYCKDCVKHNKGLGNYEVHPDGSTTWIWKDSACPLVSWRDKAQGHEFDYQFCAYAEKREVNHESN